MTDEEFDRWLSQCPLTPEEAQKAYDEAEPVPMSEERIQAIVDYATGTPEYRKAVRAALAAAGEGGTQ